MLTVYHTLPVSCKHKRLTGNPYLPLMEISYHTVR